MYRLHSRLELELDHALASKLGFLTNSALRDSEGLGPSAGGRPNNL